MVKRSDSQGAGTEQCLGLVNKNLTKKIPLCTYKLLLVGRKEECCRKMCSLNKSKTCKFCPFSKYKFTVLIQGYGYFSEKEPFLLNYVKDVIFKIHKRRKCYRIHSGFFPRTKSVCKYYVSNFNLLILLDSKQWCVLVNRLMHHSLWSMGFSLLIEQGLDKILALLMKSGGGKRQDKKHLIGNSQHGAKVQHCSRTSQPLELLEETPPEVISSVLSGAAVFQVWWCMFCLSELLLFCSSEGWPSLESIQLARELIFLGLQLCQ